MKKRFPALFVLAVAAVASIIGGAFCYPPLPQDFLEAAALYLSTNEPIPAEDSRAHTQGYGPAEIFTSEAGLTASMAANGLTYEGDVDWTAEQVVYVPGWAAANGQTVYYGVYAIESLSNPPEYVEILADYIYANPADGFSFEIRSFQTSISSGYKLQCVGSAVFTKPIVVSALVRNGLRVLPSHSPYYIRVPVNWNHRFSVS